MQISLNLCVTLLFCAVIIGAGCAQPASPVPAAPVVVPVAQVNPAHLALTQSDLPPGFTLIEGREKTNEDLSKIALELGWQGGYAARFTRPATGGTGEVEIMQSIAIYPVHTIPDVISLADRQGWSDNSLAYTELTVQGLGDNTRAISGKAGAQVVSQPSSSNPVIAGMKAQETAAVSNNDVVMIIFSKGNTFEAFRMTGTSPDIAQLVDLAHKAYAKIP
jgi:hypothetical protein